MVLTDDDLKNIALVFDQKFEEKGVVTKEDIKHLPTKDEFYKETLRILKKLDDLEVEKDVLSYNVSEHSDRIEALEKIHPQGAHFASI